MYVCFLTWLFSGASIVLKSSLTGCFVILLHTGATKNLYAYLSNFRVLSLQSQCNQYSWFHPLLDVHSDRDCVELASRLISFSDPDHGGTIHWALILSADHTIDTFMSLGTRPVALISTWNNRTETQVLANQIFLVLFWIWRKFSR